jgi:transcriptional regulator with XRE-family HTH domain
MTVNKTVSKLRQLRLERGLSASAICFKLKIHPSSMSKAELRKLVLPEKGRKSLAKFFGVDENDIFDPENGLAA